MTNEPAPVERSAHKNFSGNGFYTEMASVAASEKAHEQINELNECAEGGRYIGHGSPLH